MQPYHLILFLSPRILILSITGFFFICSADAQTFISEQQPEIFLQIERKNRLKTLRLIPGNIFEIRTCNDPNNWIKVRLLDLDANSGQIITDFGAFHIGDFRSLRTERQNRRGDQIIGYTLTFAAGTALFSLVDLFYGNPYNWEFVAVAGGMVGMSYLYKLLSRSFYYRFDRKHRLRIIDLRL